MIVLPRFSFLPLGRCEWELGLKKGSQLRNEMASQQGSEGRNGDPVQFSCLENPTDGGAWWATVHGVAESRTRLKAVNAWVFIAAHGLSLVVESGGYSLIAACKLLIVAASLVAEHGL